VKKNSWDKHPSSSFLFFSFGLFGCLLCLHGYARVPVPVCSVRLFPQTLDIHYLFLIGARSFTVVGSGAAAFSFSFHSPVPTLPIQFLCIDQTKALLEYCETAHYRAEAPEDPPHIMHIFMCVLCGHCPRIPFSTEKDRREWVPVAKL